MKDLREFIEKLRELDDLKVIDGADWNLEIGAASYLAAEKPEAPALLFDNIKDYPAGYRVLTLPINTDRRSAVAFGLPTEARGLDLVRALRAKLSRPLELVPPVEVADGPVLQNVQMGDEVDLFKFPTPQWQTLDGGRYIGTGCTVITRDPDEGWVNVGAQRVQIHDKRTATIFFESGKHGRLIREKYWSRGQACPVAVTCGSDPLLVSIAGSFLPWKTPEYDYTGWWQEEPVQVLKGPATGLPIPAHAEIVLEGEMVPPEVESREEGPFSEWTGHYSDKRQEAALRVKSVLHRDDPIILGWLPFIGPGVHNGPSYLIKAALAWDHLDKVIPGVKGVWSHIEFGGTTRCLAISLEQKYNGHAKQAAMLALGYDSYNAKYIIVVDDDIDPSNLREVLFALGNRANPERFDFIKDSRAGSLDPTLTPEKKAAGDFTHTAMIMLACKPYHLKDQYPPLVRASAELRELAKEKWGKILS